MYCSASPEYSSSESIFPANNQFLDQAGNTDNSSVSNVDDVHEFLEHFRNRLVENRGWDENDYQNLQFFCSSQTLEPCMQLFDEISTLKKLIYCWRRNKHPIGLAELNYNAVNKLNAAKTFTSLLGLWMRFNQYQRFIKFITYFYFLPPVLRKNGLIDIQPSANGQVVHIERGHVFQNVNIAGIIQSESSD